MRKKCLAAFVHAIEDLKVHAILGLSLEISFAPAFSLSSCGVRGPTLSVDIAEAECHRAERDRRDEFPPVLTLDSTRKFLSVSTVRATVSTLDFQGAAQGRGLERKT